MSARSWTHDIAPASFTTPFVATVATPAQRETRPRASALRDSRGDADGSLS